MLVTFTELTAYLTHLIVYGDYCFSQPQHWVGCGKFWAFFYFSLSFLMLLVFVSTAYKLYKNNSDYKAYLKKKAEREKIADPETMAKHIWKGE
jgi:hypothetical protein